MPTEPSMEERLVAYLDGECSASERAALDQLLQQDADLRTRLDLLAAADRALCAAFESPAKRRVFGHIWLAAAALLVVALLVWQQSDQNLPQDADPASARNDYLQMVLSPEGGGSLPLFTDAALDLSLLSSQAHGGPLLLVLRATTAATPEVTEHADVAAVRAKIAELEVAERDVLAMRMQVTAIKPDGTRLPAHIAAASHSPTEPFVLAGSQREQLRLCDLAVADPTVARPYIGGVMGRAGGEGLVQQFFQVLPAGRLIPQEPGDWSFEVSVRAVTLAGRTWPGFDKPLVAKTSLRLTGRVSEWSEAVDGIAARLLIADHPGAVGRTAIALQLRNSGKIEREYNITGVTSVEIPQPFHFELLVDGEPWLARDDLNVVTASHTLSQGHAPGAVRSIVAMPDYWRSKDLAVEDLRGRHRLQMRMHSKMLMIMDGDKKRWQGVVTTPPLAVDLPEPK